MKYHRKKLSDIQVPEDPGPAILGKTPVIGQVRRELDAPVARDRLKEL